MSVQNGERLVTKQDLADMYQGILPYLGGMPEVLANKFSKGDLYSTDEKMIGQWIDGKPLYQKTVTGNVVLSTWLDMGVADDITVVGIKGTASNTNDNGTLPISYANTGSYTLSVVANPNTNKGKFVFFGASNYASNHAFRLTFQYTKANDTAISIGSDTDYSTEEKIVGTWIDGKPLYQCVIITTSTISLTANTWFTSSISVPNIETIVGGCIIDEGGNKGSIWIGHNANTLLLLSSRTNNWLANAKIIIQYTKTTG